MEKYYTITASINTLDTYLDMLAEALGYKAKINQWNPETGNQEEIDNPESRLDFVSKMIKQILVNETTRPIQSMIYNQANKEANTIYEDIRKKADDNMNVVIEEQI